MTEPGLPAPPPVASIAGVRLRYGRTVALDGVDLDVPAGVMIGLIGPDGVGKSSLLSLVAGVPVARTRPASMATSQSKRAASSM